MASVAALGFFFGANGVGLPGGNQQPPSAPREALSATVPPSTQQRALQPEVEQQQQQPAEQPGFVRVSLTLAEQRQRAQLRVPQHLEVEALDVNREHFNL